MLKNLISRITAKHTASAVSPDADKVISALERLERMEEYQIFIALLRSQYSDLAKAITTCSGDATDHIRGQMFAIDKICSTTAEEYRQQEARRKEIEEAIKAEADIMDYEDTGRTSLSTLL